MTFAIFIVLILGVFIALLNVAPTAAALGINITPAVVSVFAYVKAWNFLFPISESLVLMGIMLNFEIAVWLWRNSARTIRFLRGHSDGA